MILEPLLADDLTEHQALKLEAELIAAFGTEDTGGILTNSVIPRGRASKLRGTISIPAGSVEQAQIGLELLKNSVLELAKANLDGITNSDASKTLGLQSDYGGGSKDYLAWSLLGLLMKEGKIVRAKGQKKHKAAVR